MDFQEALSIHKELFPKANVRSQLLQFNEEKAEYETADNIEDAYNEYGDLIFVIISLMRFEETREIATLLLDIYYFSYPIEEQNIFMNHLAKAITKVRARCADKKYKLIDGIYKRDKNLYRSVKC
jgi:uncharacterized protein YabN with tetrapyrrole methylase and pyrophosphatase domain